MCSRITFHCALICVYWSKRREQRAGSGALPLFTLKESRQPWKPYPQSVYIQASSVSIINRDSVFKFFISHRQMLNTLFCTLLTFTDPHEMLRFIAKKLNSNQIQFDQIFVFFSEQSFCWTLHLKRAISHHTYWNYHRSIFSSSHPKGVQIKNGTLHLPTKNGC